MIPADSNSKHTLLLFFMALETDVVVFGLSLTSHYFFSCLILSSWMKCETDSDME